MIKPVDDNSPLNVHGTALESCSVDPMTGFFRDGCCNTNEDDAGSHTVCIETTEVFLKFSRVAGNDLSTPMPKYGFPGLKAGDRWCLCAARWHEAYKAGMAPRVFLKATHEKALDIIPLELLKEYAVEES